jgi:hypothetical protein
VDRKDSLSVVNKMMNGHGSGNWTSLKKNLRKKSSSAWSLKIKNSPSSSGHAAKSDTTSYPDPTSQLAAALAGISHGNQSIAVEGVRRLRF